MSTLRDKHHPRSQDEASFDGALGPLCRRIDLEYICILRSDDKSLLATFLMPLIISIVKMQKVQSGHELLNCLVSFQMENFYASNALVSISMPYKGTPPTRVFH